MSNQAKIANRPFVVADVYRADDHHNFVRAHIRAHESELKRGADIDLGELGVFCINSKEFLPRLTLQTSRRDAPIPGKPALVAERHEICKRKYGLHRMA